MTESTKEELVSDKVIVQDSVAELEVMLKLFPVKSIDVRDTEDDAKLAPEQFSVIETTTVPSAGATLAVRLTAAELSVGMRIAVFET